MEQPLISAIIATRNEAESLRQTLKVLRRSRRIDEVIVVDHGSTDHTGAVARRYADRMISRKEGWGAAWLEGMQAARGAIFLLLDAQAKERAKLSHALISPLLQGEADMTLAHYPAEGSANCIPLVRRLASYGVRTLTGHSFQASFSGQRALRREIMSSLIYRPTGRGMELGMMVQALANGYVVKEIPLPLGFHHLYKRANLWKSCAEAIGIISAFLHLWRVSKLSAPS
ncbi:glycosyltransferase family 2 protein [Mechercharimyces sp. CAU 1602]|uniref:glycosyltransferase family 2 protein n=1 Tax=Mechercharimyces sp. CAU 1602 TaxID=2973933 RepID=UPI002161E9F4|nr:glycosyltransferase family 2 protein [Mechercharimyces sp. CAU 1602]MCS1350798.1 glycosyltransferase family 2 protein [Mechercharimyces sp. CAU 1602]